MVKIQAELFKLCCKEESCYTQKDGHTHTHTHTHTEGQTSPKTRVSTIVCKILQSNMVNRAPGTLIEDSNSDFISCVVQLVTATGVGIVTAIPGINLWHCPLVLVSFIDIAIFIKMGLNFLYRY